MCGPGAGVSKPGLLLCYNAADGACPQETGICSLAHQGTVCGILAPGKGTETSQGAGNRRCPLGLGLRKEGWCGAGEEGDAEGGSGRARLGCPAGKDGEEIQRRGGRPPHPSLPQAPLLGQAKGAPGNRAGLCLTVGTLLEEGRSAVTGDRGSPAEPRGHSVGGGQGRPGAIQAAWQGGTLGRRHARPGGGMKA